MALRVARAAEAEAPDLRDGAHEIDGVAIHIRPRVVARRHVAAKRQDVLHAGGAEASRLLKYLLARGHYASEVGERRRAALVLDERG